MSSNDVANKEVSAIRAALSDRISRNECTPKKRSLGNIVLYPSAFQCPWADRLAHGEICSDVHMFVPVAFFPYEVSQDS